MPSSILQGVTIDRSSADDATLVLLGLLSACKRFVEFVDRAAPPVEDVETPVVAATPDPTVALVLGILAFHRRLEAGLARLVVQGIASSASPAAKPERAVNSPRQRGLLR
jgi:hypothetical protein